MKVIAEREVVMQGKSIKVLARNTVLPVSCDECGQPATWICTECVYEDKGNLCEAWAQKQTCGEEMLLPQVNSPREGVCGYTGPARAYSW